MLLPTVRGIFTSGCNDISENAGNCSGDAPAPARAAEGIARAVSVALLPHLQALKEEGLTPLAVRVTLDQDNVSQYSPQLIIIHDGGNLICVSRSNMRRVLEAQLYHLPSLQALTMSWSDTLLIITLATRSDHS